MPKEYTRTAIKICSTPTETIVVTTVTIPCNVGIGTMTISKQERCVVFAEVDKEVFQIEVNRSIYIIDYDNTSDVQQE